MWTKGGNEGARSGPHRLFGEIFPFSIAFSWKSRYNKQRWKAFFQGIEDILYGSKKKKNKANGCVSCFCTSCLFCGLSVPDRARDRQAVSVGGKGTGRRDCAVGEFLHRVSRHTGICWRTWASRMVFLYPFSGRSFNCVHAVVHQLVEVGHTFCILSRQLFDVLVSGVLIVNVKIPLTNDK